MPKHSIKNMKAHKQFDFMAFPQMDSLFNTFWQSMLHSVGGRKDISISANWGVGFHEEKTQNPSKQKRAPGHNARRML